METSSNNFGLLLRTYREKGFDPVRGKKLTQSRLAELLEPDMPGGVTASTVSNWERGVYTISRLDRTMLVCLIQVLHETGGIQSLAEADRLLKAGGYSSLTANECAKISPTWRQEPPSYVARTSSPPSTSSSATPPSHSQGQHSQTHYSKELTSPFYKPDAPFMVPPLPPQGVIGRDDYLERITAQLSLDEDNQLINPLVLRGMGGIGKTTLVKSLGHLLNQHFVDGVLWAELGPNANIRPILNSWGSMLGIDLLPERDEATCRDRLQSMLYRRQVLLLIDDVWEAESARYFTVGGPNCRTLITTRGLAVANGLVVPSRIQKVDLLSPESSLALLRQLAPAVAIDEMSARKLVERLEYLPLAITLAGRMLANQADIPSRMNRLLGELLERKTGLDALQLTQTEARMGVEADDPISIHAILGLSVERLAPIDRERFAYISVFGEPPLTWTIDAAASVWSCSLEEAEDTIASFIRLGLVDKQGIGDNYWMHALLWDYADGLLDVMG